MKRNLNESEQGIQTDWKSLRVRLDAIVLLLLRQKMNDEEGRVILSEAAPLLHAAGYTPTEIANLFGKKKATEVSQYIYPKKKKS